MCRCRVSDCCEVVKKCPVLSKLEPEKEVLSQRIAHCCILSEKARQQCTRLQTIGGVDVMSLTCGTTVAALS